MKIMVLDQINTPSGDKPSEDCIGFDLERGSFWVVDGATDLYPDQRFLTSEPSDAYWCAQNLDSLFKTAAEKGEDSGDVRFFTSILQSLRSRFFVNIHHDGKILKKINKSKDRESPPSSGGNDDVPSSTGIWFGYKKSENILLTTRARDCEAHVITDEGGYFANAPSMDDKRYDAGYSALIRRNLKPGDTFSLEDAKTLRYLREQRGFALMDSLTIFPSAAERFSYQTFLLPKNTGATVLLASDGFLRLVDIFEAYTHQDLIRAAMPEAKGLPGLVAELRSRETQAIAEGDTRQVKGHDDASALLLRIEP